MTQDDNIELWQYLANQKRSDRNLTNKRFAEKLGVTNTTLSRIVNYRHCPSVELAKKIEKQTGYAVVWHNLMERCSKLR